MNQIELELMAYGHGRERAKSIIERSAEKGRASSNPYAQPIFRRFIQPLGEVMLSDRQEKGPGRRKAHLVLMDGMDPETVAYIAVRVVLNNVLSGETSAQAVTREVGKAVYHEYCLKLFEAAEPDLFYTITQDFERKLSKSERHRMTVYRMQAEKAGHKFIEWGWSGILQVGGYLIETLEMLGMIQTNRYQTMTPKGLHYGIDIIMTEAVADLIAQVEERVISTTPYYLPCIEPPKPWNGLTGGGFHTREMQRMSPYAIYSGPAVRDRLKEADLGVDLGAINKLQEVRWQVNARMFSAVQQVAKHFDMEEVLSQAEFPAPPRPPFLDDVSDRDDMTEDQLKEFTDWKREKAEWYTQMKLRGTKWGRYTTAMRIAHQFLEYEAIWFVYFADWRGRKYCRTTGINPQGSDLQKALLHFAEGKPLDSQEAVEWFLMAGANRWGYDKAPLPKRVQWALERREQIIAMADNPVANNEWREADKPLQFLAWAFEFRDYMKDPDNFLSHQPIGMDGSCNGLQNFSAMLRDEIGGKATNLVPPEDPDADAEDIYGLVAKETTRLLTSAVEEDLDKETLRVLWLQHGINRTVVKRSVMTLPYGSTRFSCATFIVDDYLRHGKAIEFSKDQYGAAGQYLSTHVWQAINTVVVKAAIAMRWLQQSCRKLIKEGHETLSWVSPTGLPVCQAYWKSEVKRIVTLLHGGAKLRAHSETDKPDPIKHANGIAPNFIHSLDAAHMTLVVLEASRRGISSLAMIHDDFGTHASDAAALYSIIREVFVSIYSTHDPLLDFFNSYPGLSEVPESGSLDLGLVVDSPFFFS